MSNLTVSRREMVSRCSASVSPQNPAMKSDDSDTSARRMWGGGGGGGGGVCMERAGNNVFQNLYSHRFNTTL